MFKQGLAQPTSDDNLSGHAPYERKHPVACPTDFLGVKGVKPMVLCGLPMKKYRPLVFMSGLEIFMSAQDFFRML